MPQPTFALSGGLGILRFGGLALPNGQGTMAYQNLNDGKSWFLQTVQNLDINNRQVTLGQLIYRARAAYLADDWGPWKFKLPFIYYEGTDLGGPGTPLGQALAQLTQAGEQYLTTDNATALPVKVLNVSGRKWLNQFPPLIWAFDIEFYAKARWWQDQSSTSLSAVSVVNSPTAAPTGAVAAGGALAVGTYALQYTYVTSSGETAPSPVSAGIALTTGNQQISVSGVTLPSWASAVKWYFGAGSPTTGFTVQNNGAAFTLNTAGNGTAPPASTPATSFSIAYAGSVWAEPTFTLTIPNANTGVITSATLANTMSGETLTMTFPGGLAASTAYTITIDCGNFSVRDGSGKAYDVAGSFPQLYPPAGQSNPFTIAVATSSGVAAGLTLGGSWTNRWEL